MFKIKFETYNKLCSSNNITQKNNKIALWRKIYDIQIKLGVKNMSDLTIKSIKGIYDTKTLTNEQIRKYKGYGVEFINNWTGIYVR